MNLHRMQQIMLKYLNIKLYFNIIDNRISFNCNNLDLLFIPPKCKFTFRNLKKWVQELHRKFVLAPANKAATYIVVV